MSDIYSEEAKKKLDSICVAGFVRRIEKAYFSEISESMYDHIPVEIVNICSWYYHIPKDKFNELHGPRMEVQEDRVRTLSSNYNSAGLNYAYLSNIVDSGYHHWTFRVNKLDEMAFIYIGIWNDAVEANEHLEGWPQNVKFKTDGEITAFYGLNITLGELRGGDSIGYAAYGTAVRTEDIIDMYLDLEKYELSYGIKGQNYGKAFDIQYGASYRALVCMDAFDHDQEIEILSYL